MQSPTDPNRPWNLNFWANPPGKGNWIKVKGSAYSKEDIIRQQMMIPLMTDNHTNLGTDSEARWNLAKVVMGRGASSILSNRKIKPLYLTAMYEQGLEEGITYWETRRSVGPMYSVNPDPRFNGTSGQEVLPGGIGLDINITLGLVEKFTKLHPEFIGHKRIYYNTRQDSTASISRDVGIVAETMITYPDHVLGWDLVGEEDAGNSLLYYLGNFVQLHDVETGKSKIPLYLHTGETNWLEDLLASGNNLDPVSTLQNSYEALLLNTKRIGHGIGFIKHPYLLQMLKERGIALEICTVSNQLLGYSPDIRNHPGQEFYRMGIPIALSGDDPATFGYDEVTVDWYEAYMAWGLNLGDLKKLALNSLMYSGMSDSEKKVAIEQKWKPMWDKYIKSKKLEACGRDYTSEARNEGRDVIFAQILPKQGAIIGTTKVHLFGRNFEVGICRSIVCQFGSMNSTQAVYISNQHIVCQAPDFGDGKNRTVPVSITLDGNNFINTGFNFTYMFEPITISGSVVNRATTDNIALLFLSCLVAFRAIKSKFIFLI